jgi:hypothetical protein
MIGMTAKQPSLPRASRPRGYVPPRIRNSDPLARACCHPRSTSNLTMMTMPPQYLRSVTFYVCPLLLVHAHPIFGWVFPHVSAKSQLFCSAVARRRPNSQWRAGPPSKPWR